MEMVVLVVMGALVEMVALLEMVVLVVMGTLVEMVALVEMVRMIMAVKNNCTGLQVEFLVSES